MEDSEILPKRMYMGTINIGGKDLSCAVLDDETRVLTNTAMFKAFDRPRKGKSIVDNRLANMPSFMDANNLKPFINAVFQTGPNLFGEVKYTSKNGKTIFTGYNAEILPMICEVYLRARDANVLTEVQKPLAVVSDLLMRSLAKVGITALIDEATGYQEDRDADALQKLLSYYISEELLPWTKTFPDEFYIELFRLRGWDYKGKAKSPYVGKLTNYLVYDRLPEEVVEELKRLNPIVKDKHYRKHKHFQHLTKENGYIQLRTQILTDIAMFRAFDNWEQFDQAYRKSYNISEPLEETEKDKMIEAKAKEESSNNQ